MSVMHYQGKEMRMCRGSILTGLALLVTLCIVIMFSSCGDDKGTNPAKDDDYEMVTVTATSGFPMGWVGIEPNEEPVHAVSLDEFQIGKFEVTYELWTEVKSWAESNGYNFSNVGLQGGCNTKPCNTTYQHPVTNISWRDCIAWCNAYSEKEGLTPVYYTTSAKTLAYRNSTTDINMGNDIGNDCVIWDADGFRLPTEAEWEYAARYINGTTVSSGAYHSGYNLFPEIDDCVWYSYNSGSGTHPVEILQKNSLGTYDMSGNVYEWCWDWMDIYPETSQDNPRGPDTVTYSRVFRGGSWIRDTTDCRTAKRFDYHPAGNGETLGFRVCRSGIPR